MVIDFGGGVIPGEDGVLGAETGEGDEVFGLGNIHRLSVYAGSDGNHSARSVAERHGVDGLLHRPVIPAPVLRNPHYPPRHLHD